MEDQTKITTLGRNPASHEGTVNPPVARASTIVFPTYADLQEAQAGKNIERIYGIYGTSTHRHLTGALAELEGADACLLYPSGLSAITSALLAFLRPGDHLLMVDAAYDPTRRFCQQVLKPMGIETTYYDPMIGAGIADLIRENTKAIFLESPGSLTFEVQDVPAITRVAREHGILTMIDNTWATPLYFKPFAHGVDISIHAVTKYLGGHSDVMMGAVTCRDAQYKALFTMYHNLGLSVSAEDAALVLRGLRTLEVRLKQHQETALSLAQWFKTQPHVRTVLHPALPECPGHSFWKRDFTGASGLFTVIVDPVDGSALASMFDGLRLFAMGFSWGGYESLMIPVYPGAHRTAAPWREEGKCLRVHAGLEALHDLTEDLRNGFARLYE